MLTKHIWLSVVAMALMTTAASAVPVSSLPIPMYKAVLLPGGSTALTQFQSVGNAASIGQQGGAFIIGRLTYACQPSRDPILCTDNRTHAVLWTQNAQRPFVDLNPPGYFSSFLSGMAGNIQVGYGYPLSPRYRQEIRALAWFGSAGSMIDLNPPKYVGSMANATDGVRIVGSAFVRVFGANVREATRPHAVLWLQGSGTKQRFLPFDLNPRGYGSSEAFAVDNGYEAGYAFKSPTERHAYIWHGASANGRDLNPKGYTGSYVVGFNGQQAVGAAAESKSGGAHAYLWDLRSAVLGIDLHTAGFVETVAAATAGGKQVGWGELPSAVKGVSGYHALLWSGSAKSCIDLHAFLPMNFISSKAVAIAPDGSVVGYAIDHNNLMHAVLWVPQR